MKLISGNVCRAITALLAGVALSFLTGCVADVYGTAGPVAYDYDYYPDWDIYFYPQGRIYYWNNGGHWRSGRELPPRYRLHEETREHLQLHSRQPWTEHAPERPELQHHEGGHDRR
jgi:hypothetical protein